jgi:4'-phosphopantetheinyl transferase
MRTLTAAEFVAVESVPPLAPDEIHLWFFPPDAEPTGKRIDVVRILRRAARDRLVLLLGAYLQRPVTERDLCSGEHGKPHLASTPDLHFNMSHSGAALLLGVTAGSALGVDLEAFGRQRPVADLAGRFFTSGEATALAQLSPAAQQIAFLRLWTCKESVLKAQGHGLSFGLDRLEFFLQDGNPERLQAIAGDAGPVEQWQIVAVEPRSDMVGAVAWKGLPNRLRCFMSKSVATTLR